MKKLIITPLIAIAALFAGTSAVEAGGCQTPPPCQPCVYKVSTVCLGSCKHQQIAYDHCGRPYCYWVIVYTFKDIYSDGTYRIWKRTVTA